jgi:hypothetical protein
MIEPIAADELDIGPTVTQFFTKDAILAPDELLMPDETV